LKRRRILQTDLSEFGQMLFRSPDYYSMKPADGIEKRPAGFGEPFPGTSLSLDHHDREIPRFMLDLEGDYSRDHRFSSSLGGTYAWRYPAWLEEASLLAVFSLECSFACWSFRYLRRNNEFYA
jgi:hypothetical protein